jgi:hypothetical protein
MAVLSNASIFTVLIDSVVAVFIHGAKAQKRTQNAEMLEAKTARKGVVAASCKLRFNA